MLRRLFRLAFRVALLVAALALLWTWLGPKPSNDRHWSPDQEKLAWAEIAGDEVVVHHVRNARYRSADDYDVAWEDRAFRLDTLERVWFLVEPFDADWRGPAHTLLSFEFQGDRFLAISFEIRKEIGESFSVWKGLLRQYELMLVVGDERDLIELRTNHRRDPVFLYPMRASRESLRRLFLSLLERANELRFRPEFYNTLTNTCTTNLARHVNQLAPGRVPLWHPKVVFPGYSDELAFDLELIDTELPFAEAQVRFRVDENGQNAAGRDDFSRAIRLGL